jgi:nicotinamidase-related amidase
LNNILSFFVELLKVAEKIGRRIAALTEAARKAGIPVVYVNDNFGKWKSDFHNVIEYVINENKPGKPLAELLQPQDNDCKFESIEKRNAYLLY